MLLWSLSNAPFVLFVQMSEHAAMLSTIMFVQRQREKGCSPVSASYSLIQRRGSIQVNNEKIQHILKRVLIFLMFGKEALSDLPACRQ